MAERIFDLVGMAVLAAISALATFLAIFAVTQVSGQAADSQSDRRASARVEAGRVHPISAPKLVHGRP